MKETVKFYSGDLLNGHINGFETYEEAGDIFLIKARTFEFGLAAYFSSRRDRKAELE